MAHDAERSRRKSWGRFFLVTGLVVMAFAVRSGVLRAQFNQRALKATARVVAIESRRQLNLSRPVFRYQPRAYRTQVTRRDLRFIRFEFVTASGQSVRSFYSTYEPTLEGDEFVVFYDPKRPHHLGRKAHKDLVGPLCMFLVGMLPGAVGYWLVRSSRQET